MRSFSRFAQSSFNPWRELGGLPRESWILAAASLINRAGTMVLPFLMLHLTQNLGFTPSCAGLVLSVYGLVALLWAPVSGHLSDRLGAIWVMRLSLFSSGVVQLLLPLATTFGQILAAVALLAVTSEAFRPANLALVGDLAGPELRKQGFALNRLSINLGMSIGPALGGFLAIVSFRSIFWVDGATSLAAGLVLLSRFRDSARKEHYAPSRPPLPGLALFDPRLLYFLFALLPVMMVFFQLQAAMSLYMVRELGLSEATYGLVFTVNTLLIVLLEVRVNSATADWPYRRSLALGALLLGAGFGALAIAHTAGAIIPTVVIWTAGEMIFLPTASAYVTEIAPPARRGEYMGYYMMGFALTFAIAPWLGTVVMQRFGSPTLWAASLAFGLLSALLLLRLHEVAPVKRTTPGLGPVSAPVE